MVNVSDNIMTRTNNNQVFLVEVKPFFIRAKTRTEVEDIMWEKFGLEYSQLGDIRKAEGVELTDN